eukprot:scaffold2633_cov156-Amphora_coffeaeformis.AAC.1
MTTTGVDPPRIGNYIFNTWPFLALVEYGRCGYQLTPLIRNDDSDNIFYKAHVSVAQKAMLAVFLLERVDRPSTPS